jgi:hypothetical protein
MFFPCNNDTFFISENELVNLTFREVFESRELYVDFFEKIFLGINININIPMIDFLQKLFEFEAVI